MTEDAYLLSFDIRAANISSRDELIKLIHDLVESDHCNKTSIILALRSIGFQMMMAGNNKAEVECIQERFKLSVYATILSLPSTQISADYICLKLSEIVSYTHFSIEVFAGLYSNLVYYG